MRFTILFTFLLSALMLNAQPQLVDKVAVVIGDEIVLHSDVEIQYQQYLEQGEVPEDARCEILSQLLFNKMLLAQAMVDSVEVTEDEVDGELDKRIRHFINLLGSKEKLEEYYNKSILEIKDEFREDIADYIRISTMQSRIIKNVKVTPADVRAFFNEIPKDSLPYYNAEVEVGQIVVYPAISHGQESYAKEKIEGIRKRVLDGEDFATLASIYSDDGSASEGGALGFFERGEMVPEFEAVAFSLKQDEVSRVVRSEFGYHIVQLIEKQGQKVNVRHILIKPKVTSKDLEEAKAKLEKVRVALLDTLEFSEAVKLYSEDITTKATGGMITNPQSGNATFEMDQVDPSIYFQIKNLEPGQYSDVGSIQERDGTRGFRIIYLKSESEPHRANLKDDYYRIQAVALTKKQDDAIQQWLEAKIKETYVRVDADYEDCDDIKKWLKNP
jgi:peptidyl-prolyl cis-trans isomerase SurA